MPPKKLGRALTKPEDAPDWVKPGGLGSGIDRAGELLEMASALLEGREGATEAMIVIGAVLEAFADLHWMSGAERPGALQRLGRLADVVEQGLQVRRDRCLALIRNSGKRQSANLADELMFEEPAFESVGFPALVAQTMANYDASPKGKRGKFGAERVLAEFVYEAHGALGLVVDLDADRADAIEDIRKKLPRRSVTGARKKRDVKKKPKRL